ncbi:MAG: hypothetical protein WA952_16885, partial [Lewinella sp.]
MQWLRLTALMMLLAGCSDPDPYRPAELHLVSQAEMIQRALRFEYPEFSQITFRNETGELLAYDSLLRIPDPSVFALDYYKNDAAEIVEAVVREGTEADRVFQQRYADAANNGPELKQISVDCTDKVAFLQRIFERDQASRRTG